MFFLLGCLFAYLFQKQFSIFVKTNSRRKSWREIPGPKFDSIVFQFHLGIPVFIYTYVAYIIYTCIRSINIQYIICIIFAGIDLYIYIYICSICSHLHYRKRLSKTLQWFVGLLQDRHLGMGCIRSVWATQIFRVKIQGFRFPARP